MYIRSKHIFFEDGERDGYLVVEGKKIVGFLGTDATVTDYVDYTDLRVIPGIMDTHNHATMGYSPNGNVGGEAEIRGYLKGLASQGTALVFPTLTILDGGDKAYPILARLADDDTVDGATILGIHSEGPFGNRVGEKGIKKDPAPIDMQVIKDTVRLANGKLKVMGFAPELPGADEAIKYLTENGVRVSFQHSEMLYAEAREAFKKGVTVVTHTANVMRGIHHRNMGGLGACLLDPDINCEVICDCLHNSQEMLELMFRVKQNPEKWMMVSDSSAAAGAPTGKYRKGEKYANITEEGFSLDPTGRLSGSTKPVLFGVKNLVTRLGMPLEQVVRMSSLTTCQTYGLADERGSIKIGKYCDLTVIDDDYNCVATYTNGRKVYDRDVDGDCFNPDYVAQFRIGDCDENPHRN